jgi:uracil phosphoribosyltransferase
MHAPRLTAARGDRTWAQGTRGTGRTSTRGSDRTACRCSRTTRSSGRRSQALRDERTRPRTSASTRSGSARCSPPRDHSTSHTDGTVRTPLADAPTVTPSVPDRRRAGAACGLGLLPGVHDALPEAQVGMIGLERDPVTLEARRYYFKVPPLEGAWVLVLEPMLATGGSASDAVRALDTAGAAQVIVLCVVATEQGVRPGARRRPRARIVDRRGRPGPRRARLHRPGLGDFGDRLFGTPH